MTKGVCDERVWSNGDMEDCGKPTTHKSNVCDSCRALKIPYMEINVAKLKKKLAEAKAKLELWR